MLNVKTTLYSALKNDATLVALAPGGIFADKKPKAGSYPCIVLAEISNVPAVSADDEEEVSRVTAQISVMTDSGSTTAIAGRVDFIMTINLGFSRQFSGDIIDGDIKIKAMRYVILG